MKPLNRRQMAWRAAQDVEDGSLVNLGLGMPLFVADYLPEGRDVFLHSENGVVGVGYGAEQLKSDRPQVSAICVKPLRQIIEFFRSAQWVTFSARESSRR